MSPPAQHPQGNPSPQSDDVDVFGLTDRGRVREDNQDHFLIATLHKLVNVRQTSLPEAELPTLVSHARGYLFLVADGVGSRPDGHLASGTALRTVADYVTHFTDLYRRLDPAQEGVFLRELTRSVKKSHEVLLEQAQNDPSGRGLATTLTMVAAVWPRAYLVQVGDSRCYRLRGETLQLMSRDQTLAQELVDSGALSSADAERSPLRNVLASALGGRELTPMTATVEIEWGDVMLLCTDGLTKHVSDEEIQNELARLESAEGVCRRLMSLALERGGTDNVTVIVGHLRPRENAAGS
jgi:protein phosphatase